MMNVLTPMFLAPAAIGLGMLLAGSGDVQACGSHVDTDLAGRNLQAAVVADGNCHDARIFMRGQDGGVNLYADGEATDTQVYSAGSNRGQLDVVTGGGKAMVFSGICRYRDRRVVPVGTDTGREVVVVGCR